MIDATPELVRETFAKKFSELKPEAQSSFRQRFLVHDYESFPNDALLVALDIRTGRHYTLWGCDEIRAFLRREFLRHDATVLVGYNNKSFDNRLTDAILAGADDQSVKRLSDELVADGGRDIGWRSGQGGRKPDWTGRTFDIGFDIGQKKIGDPPNERKIPEVGLKRWERLNGFTVKRSSVPFDRKVLSRRDREEAAQYCLDDCCATAMCLLSKEAWDPCLNARRALVDEYEDKGVDWEVTKPRIAGLVMNAREENFEVPADWERGRFVVPPEIRIWKHRDILRAYTEHTYGELRAMSSRKAGGKGVALKNVCGIPHVYGVGGVHGCPKGVWQACGGGIWSLDAASLYPNIMRHYGYLSRRVVGSDRDRFGKLIDLRVKVYKPAEDKRAEGLKLVTNGCFGSMGFEKSEMYDPENFHNVTILGQLLLTDLLEKLERHIELIQSNTDGIFFRLRDKSGAGMAECREIVRAFQLRTRLEMEWTEFERMYQKDVSSFVARKVAKAGMPADSGEIKKKSAWFAIKHCTVTPYLYESRIYSALNGGATLPTDGFDMERFSIELKRDKNSDCFEVDGRPDYREWLDVVPVRHGSRKAQKIVVIQKDDGSSEGGLFDGLDAGLSMRKRRKATGCPAPAALVENVAVEDIDLGWYARDNTLVDCAGHDIEGMGLF